MFAVVVFFVEDAVFPRRVVDPSTTPAIVPLTIYVFGLAKLNVVVV
jgi:hypothetical protein